MQRGNHISALLGDRNFLIQVLILSAATVVLMSLAFFWGGINFVDDAYITFRYARNFAEGNGITWNIAEAPTQGSTTFNFVILVGMGLKLGLSAEVAAFVLNVIGNVVIVVTLHLTYRLMFDDKSLFALIPSLAILTYAGTLELTISGMEAVFWTGMLYSALFAILVYIEKKQSLFLAPVFILAYLAALTRPESALVVGLWFIYLLWTAVGRQRLYLMGGMVVFGIAGVLYVLWLQSYYGYVLPNSFYIKVGSGLSESGIVYVRNFFIFFLLKPITIISLVGIILLIRQKFHRLAPHFIMLALLPVYLFTDPLMGGAFRFVHPASVLVVFLLAVGGLYHFGFIWQAVKQSRRIFVVRGRALILGGVGGLAVVLFVFSFFNYSATFLFSQLKGGLTEDYLREPTIPIWQTARALAAVPEIENASIIYGDAGIVAYETMAHYIDPVGLNHSLIAHEAREKGAQWVVELLMDADADLIAFYTDYGGQISNGGHGVVGTAYSDLYQHETFQENYVEIGAIDYNWVITRWFIHQDSPYREAVDQALEPLQMENPPPVIP